MRKKIIFILLGFGLSRLLQGGYKDAGSLNEFNKYIGLSNLSVAQFHLLDKKAVKKQLRDLKKEGKNNEQAKVKY